MTMDLVVPTSRELVIALDSPTLWMLEQAGEVAREVLDERIVAWTQEGWTQQRIANEIGCSQQTVSNRQARVGVKPSQPHAPRSNKRVVTSENGAGPQIVDAEVVPEAEPTSTDDDGGEVERHNPKPTRPHRRPTSNDPQYIAAVAADLSTASHGAASAAQHIVAAMRGKPDSATVAEWVALVDVVLADMRTVRREIQNGSAT